MHYDYFITARYRNKEQALALATQLRERGKSVYCFAESEASQAHVESVNPQDNEAAMTAYESIKNWREDPRIRDIFETDMEAMRASDAIVVLLPVGKSGHIEAGVGYGIGKTLIQIGEQKETESLYLIFNEVYANIESFISNLQT